MEKDGEPGEGKAFLSVYEATMAYNEGDIGRHSKIKIRMTKEINGEKVTKLVPTTLGKICLLYTSLCPSANGISIFR